MRNRVTVIPADNAIYIDSECLLVEFEAPANIHAIQWQGDHGHIEFNDGTHNKILLLEDYDIEIFPYVVIWENEKNKLVQEQNKPLTTFEQIAKVQASFLTTQAKAKDNFLTARIEGDIELEHEAQLEYQESIEAMKQATAAIVGE